MIGRRKLFASWKDQVDLAQSLALTEAAADAAVRTEGLFELSVCPSMTALASVANVSANPGNAHRPEPGLGPPSQPDRRDVGPGPDRRRLSLRDRRPLRTSPLPGEAEDIIARKLRTAFAHRLTPILCVGDTLDEYRVGNIEAAVRSQLKVLFAAHHLTSGPFLVA